ncbi:transposase [Rhizobium sp. XQZ8]|uniref:transposase n=1 Tax=Rhizobium populisoli TaxID=2859785 RepID=UPI001CA5119B|nr:transposase [Rhizobium populisoli]MBW6425185.1 transposase [Rhizobium populisoli]
MAEEDVQAPADVTATNEPEQTALARQKKIPRPKKAVAEKASASAPVVARPKTRGLTDQEKQDRVSQIEKDVAGGATLKDAVKTVGISDQTYYQWKKAAAKLAVAPVASKASDKSVSADDEIAEFIALEEENRRLRKLVAEKLRAENADLRKRLRIE